MNNSRNLILAVVLSALLLFGWDAAMGWLYPQPVEVQQAEKVDTPAENAALTNSGTNNGGTVGAGPVAPTVDLATALRGGNRVRIDAPRVQGSINLEGARIDDLVLKDYRESTEPGSDYVRLFAPEGTETQQWAEFGFLANGQRAGMGATWTADGDVLSPDSPVVLTRTGEDGLRYRIALSIDDEYMITAQQTVGNPGQSGAVIQPFSYIARTSDTATKDMWIAHSGPIGVFDGSADYDFDYDDVAEAGSVAAPGRAAWLGFTDIYWLSALVPVQTAEFRADFRSLGNDLFRADLIHDPVTLAGGQQTSSSTRLFAGAKESAVLDAYQDSGITQFGLAIDWGWFRWFEKPLLWLLRFFNGVVGNFGVAIILLTVVVRGLMFPVAQKQFSSMAAMKAIQPKMKAVQEKYKDDRTKQQQEIQKLFKDEGVNPLAGCLPLILQIPIFFALYKAREVPVGPRPVRARSVESRQWIGGLGYRSAELPDDRVRDRRARSAARLHHVADLQDEPQRDGPGPAADLLYHAVDPDVRDGALRRRPAALLEHQQHPDAGAAEISLFQEPAAARSGGEGTRGKGRRGGSEGERVSIPLVIESAAKQSSAVARRALDCRFLDYLASCGRSQ